MGSNLSELRRHLHRGPPSLGLAQSFCPFQVCLILNIYSGRMQVRRLKKSSLTGRVYCLLPSLMRATFIWTTAVSIYSLGETITDLQILLQVYTIYNFFIKILFCTPFYEESHLSNLLLSSFFYPSIYLSVNKLKINECHYLQIINFRCNALYMLTYSPKQ